MKKEALENIKMVSFGYLITIGLVLFILLIDADKASSHLWLNFNQIFQISIFVVGVIIAGLSFTSFRTKELSISYLTLPASNLEKLVSQLLIVTIGVMISYTLVFFISQFLFIAIGKAFYTIEIGFFNPFDIENLQNIGILIIGQSMFMAGASFFRKNAIIKSGVFIFILWMILFGIFGYLMSTTISNLPNNVGLIADFGISNTHINYNALNIIETKYLLTSQILSVFFNYLLFPILMVITYFNIKEKEV